MAKVLIRTGSVLDLSALTSLNAEVQAIHFASRPDQFKAADLVQIERWVADLLAAPSTRAWVAELEGTVVGYAIVIRRERAENPFCPARVWWDVDAMGVRAEHRGSGIGRALLQAVASEARAQGISEVELNCWAFNTPAQAAFRSLGFTPKAIRFELRV